MDKRMIASANRANPTIFLTAGFNHGNVYGHSGVYEAGDAPTEPLSTLPLPSLLLSLPIAFRSPLQINEVGLLGGFMSAAAIHPSKNDLGFDANAASADSSNWDRPYLRTFLSEKLSHEEYDVVFTLLPTAQTHGHHRAAALLALEAVSHVSGERPLIFGAEPRGRDEVALTFSGLPDEPLTRTLPATPALVFDRETAFGYRESLNYQIVANWLIAEHKSQGLFQKDYGQHRFEQFWLFAASGDTAFQHLSRLQTVLDPGSQQTQ